MKTKTYDVQIEAIVTKTIRVNAIDEEDAYDLAHEIFTPAVMIMKIITRSTR